MVSFPSLFPPSEKDVWFHFPSLVVILFFLGGGVVVPPSLFVFLSHRFPPPSLPLSPTELREGDDVCVVVS